MKCDEQNCNAGQTLAASGLLAALEIRFRRRARDLRALGRGDSVAELMAAMYDGLAYDLHAELEAANDLAGMELHPPVERVGYEVSTNCKIDHAHD